MMIPSEEDEDIKVEKGKGSSPRQCAPSDPPPPSEEQEEDVEYEFEKGGSSPALQQRSLYETVIGPMQQSFLMFVVPEIRMLAQQGALKGDEAQIDRVLHLPCSVYDLSAVYQTNFDMIQKELVKCEERADMYKGSLSMDFWPPDPVHPKKELSKKSFLVVFDDENAQEECVYGIGVNHVTKRINVIFRGSVTQKDFQQDAKILLGTVRNPVAEGVDMADDVVAIHLGFRDYLYGKSEGEIRKALFLPNLPRNKDERDDVEAGKEKVKIEVIMDQVTTLLEENPGYELTVTGHSLGGALATIFAFEAAACRDERIVKPVQCITTGAPKVGNLDFLIAFEQLEASDKVRCLRVANYRDPVTLSPPMGVLGFCKAVFFQRRRFRHVGLRLKLTPTKYLVSYPPKVRSYAGVLFFDELKWCKSCFFFSMFVPLVAFFGLPACAVLAVCTCSGLKQLRKEHTQLRYMNRVLQHADDFQRMSLEQLYEERASRSKWRINMLRGDLTAATTLST